MIDLRHPVRSELRRGFQPPWYTVYVYRCDLCQQELFIRANAFGGSRPEQSVGGIRCGYCEEEEYNVDR